MKIPPTIFNVCSPNPVVQRAMFEKLLKRDDLQAGSIPATHFVYPDNKFLCFAEGHHAVLQAIDEVRSSTNPIYISAGLISDFFIKLEDLDFKKPIPSVAAAFYEFRKQFLGQIRIVHLFLRTHEGDNPRRTALTTLWNLHDTKENEIWFNFEEGVDPARVSKQIIECLKEKPVEEEE